MAQNSLRKQGTALIGKLAMRFFFLIQFMFFFLVFSFLPIVAACTYNFGFLHCCLNSDGSFGDMIRSVGLCNIHCFKPTGASSLRRRNDQYTD